MYVYDLWNDTVERSRINSCSFVDVEKLATVK